MKTVSTIPLLLCLAACCANLLSCQTNTQAGGQRLDSATIHKQNDIAFADTLSDNWLIVKSTVYNKPAFLLFDNGTSRQQELLLFNHYAAANGIIDTTVFLGTEMKRIERERAPFSIGDVNDSVKVEIHTVSNAPVHKMPDGILGQGFINKHVLVVDYHARRFQLLDTAGFVLPAGYQTIDVKPEGLFYRFSADVFIQGKIYREDLYLDLGHSADGLLFGIRFYQEHKNQLRLDGKRTKEIFTQFSKSKATSLLVDSIVINGVGVKQIPSTIETASNVSYMPLLAGNSVLRRFGKVIFDLGRNRIFVQKKP